MSGSCRVEQLPAAKGFFGKRARSGGRSGDGPGRGEEKKDRPDRMGYFCAHRRRQRENSDGPAPVESGAGGDEHEQQRRYQRQQNPSSPGTEGTDPTVSGDRGRRDHGHHFPLGEPALPEHQAGERPETGRGARRAARGTARRWPAGGRGRCCGDGRGGEGHGRARARDSGGAGAAGPALRPPPGAGCRSARSPCGCGRDLLLHRFPRRCARRTRPAAAHRARGALSGGHPPDRRGRRAHHGTGPGRTHR